MKAVIITNSTNYEPRAEKVGLFLQRHGHQVMWLETNFNHMEKAKKKRQLADHHYIDTVPYKKNMSIVDTIYPVGDYAIEFLNGHGTDVLEKRLCRGDTDYTLL